MPASEPAVSVIVVADGPWDETFRCLLALTTGAAGVPHEVIVVDDATADETQLALPRLEGVRSVRTDTRRGVIAGANAGASIATGRHLAFLHSDAVPSPGWLAALVRAADADPAVAVVGSRLVTEDGALESDGLALAPAGGHALAPHARGAGGPAIPSAEVAAVEAVSGAALLVPRATFERLGGFDPAFREACEDVDLCLRARAAGGRVVVAKESVAVHVGRCGRSADEVAADLGELARRWAGASSRTAAV